MMAITPIVRNLLIINVLIFLLDSSLRFSGQFALFSYFSTYFQPFQFVTYMFLHSGWGHIFGNLFGLFIFGPLLERMWGSKRFLFFYLFTGIGAGVLFWGISYFEMAQAKTALDAYISAPTPEGLLDYLSKYNSRLYELNLDFINRFENHPTDSGFIQASIQLVTNDFIREANIPMVGASGAIFGILMAFGLLFPNTELYLLFFPFPIKAKYFVTFYGLYELYAGLQNAQSDNVAHFAHIGGMVFAFILLKYWNSQKTNYY